MFVNSLAAMHEKKRQCYMQDTVAQQMEMEMQDRNVYTYSFADK